MQEVGLDDEPEDLFATPDAKPIAAKVDNPLEVTPIDDPATDNSSGYASHPANSAAVAAEVPRSDTLEDVNLSVDSSPEKVTVSPAPHFPEPSKSAAAATDAADFAPVRLSDHPSPPGSETAGRSSRSGTQSPQPGAGGAAGDEYAEEENPFQVSVELPVLCNDL